MINSVQLKKNTHYVLHKVLENGQKVFVTSALTGENPISVVVGYRCNVGYGDLGWSTSPVLLIQETEKGVRFETYNSVYLLEEHVRESKKHSQAS